MTPGDSGDSEIMFGMEKMKNKILTSWAGWARVTGRASGLVGQVGWKSQHHWESVPGRQNLKSGKN